jgi:hypothetical protein
VLLLLIIGLNLFLLKHFKYDETNNHSSVINYSVAASVLVFLWWQSGLTLLEEIQRGMITITFTSPCTCLVRLLICEKASQLILISLDSPP